jgi:N-acetylneuraminic acid mutarotase
MNGNCAWNFGTAMLGAVYLLAACGGSGGGGSLVATWVSGADVVNQVGVYGSQGTAAPANVPGGRHGSVSWIDSNGHLWLFGGNGYDSAGNLGRLSDLWQFDGSQWTWVSGAEVINQKGIYGTQGTAAPANVPGAREGAISWKDSQGHIWLFGGNGEDSAGSGGYLNDLWESDGSQWTWVSGANVISQVGVYGSQGTAAPANVPGGRHGSVSSTDSQDHLWFFGGFGFASAGNWWGYLNDLWEYDGSQWTWVSGADVVDQVGVYGSQGTAAPANVPGGRFGSVSGRDSFGNLWLFGGQGYDSAGNLGGLNDLWKFDGSTWTWVSGAAVCCQNGVYGVKGTASPSNMPGARYGSVSWIDSNGHLWLFGGSGYDSAGSPGVLNDLWEFDGSTWTWVSGAKVINQKGIYGSQGTVAPANVPGGRYGSVSWVDSNGYLWLFGGFGFASAGNFLGDLNDLWKLTP